MADKPEQTEETEAKNVNDVPLESVASLSIPTIISALHQKALKETNAASKGAKITNSAIEDGKDKLNSAGEHIISVIPAEEGKELDKKTAIELLKTYVQWFVGPDLAKKVDSSTVKSLLEAPDTKKNDSKDEKNESKKFMSFRQYLLLEADGEEPPKFEDSEEKKEEPEEKEEGSEPPKFEGDDKEKKDNGKEDSKKDSDDKKDDNIGYYIPYSLKVEGMPQTALKDSMKKFAKTFFDDVKFTASGLFGGSDSFTVKDVKDKWNEAFGPVDPDELVNNVEKELKTKYPKSDFTEVKVQDQDTLISDLGNQIDAAQKKLIKSAKYSLFIAFGEKDAKRPLMNTRTIADIVTGSIKGLFKKFKNKITKNDVVFIPDYADEHKDTKKLKELQGIVPDTPELMNQMAKASNAYDVYQKIKTLMDKVEKHPQYDNSKIANACYKVWTNFISNFKDDFGQLKQYAGKNAIKSTFDKFFDAYKKAYDTNYDKSLNENFSHMLYNVHDIKYLILESFFNEDESIDKNAEDKAQFTVDKLKTQVKRMISQSKLPEAKIIDVGSAMAIKNACTSLNNDVIEIEKTENDDLFKGGFWQGILVDYTGYVDSISNSKSLDESIRDDMLEILFGKTLAEADDEKKSKINGLTPKQEDQLKIALTTALGTFNISDYANQLIAVNQKIATKFKKNPAKAYVLPFGKKNVLPKLDIKDIDNSSAEGKGRTDLYIVPIPDMNYKDKEYDTYA